jgi:hypothetical protein
LEKKNCFKIRSKSYNIKHFEVNGDFEIERKLLAPKLQTISNFFLRKNFDRSAEFSAAAAKLKKKQFEVF